MNYELEIQPEIVNQEPSSIKNFDRFIATKKFYVTANETISIVGAKVKLKEIIAGDLAAYSVALNDFIIAVGNVGTAKTITLPSPSLAGFGKTYIIKDSSGSCASTTITINPYSTELINGDTSYILQTNFGVVGFYTNGTNWFSA